MKWKFERLFYKNVSYVLLSFNLILVASISKADVYDGIGFKDIATNPEKGIHYQRAKSPSDLVYEVIKQQGIYHLDEVRNFPANTRGAPGIAIIDYDGDGDQDIYVTNGPGTANSLYSNQLIEYGHAYFKDVAIEAGVAAFEQDSTGVCFGDIDNDGDPDMLVLGNGMGSLLYENLGEGKFKNISILSGIADMKKHPSSCAMGDVNGDGLLDLAIANTFNWKNRLPLMSFDHEFLTEHNQLFINKGNNKFMDRSTVSGIQTISRITWALALVDYDQDGDVDLITADDQGPRAPAKYGGADLGYIRIYNNDGMGQFTELTQHAGLERFGAWMGLSFGDLNADGHMDFFASNIGDYTAFFTAPMFFFDAVLGEWASMWFFGTEDGKFIRGNEGTLGTSVFGWGTSMADYDNDGDTDIIYHGGLDVVVFEDASNPGVILQNDGSGNFHWDSLALSDSTNHTLRNVRGMAVGDLDNNGFVDIVSVSNQNWPETLPLVPYAPSPLIATPLGGVFDDKAVIWPTSQPAVPLEVGNPETFLFVWTGLNAVEGSLSVELNNGKNHNNWAKISLQGSAGILDNGQVNRDGIGAVMRFTPEGGKTAMIPVLGGSSYASQNSLESVFGMGKAEKGMFEVLWPGGVRNRLYKVHKNEHIVFPEIPCSFDTSLAKRDYSNCVYHALVQLYEQDLLSHDELERYMSSAMRAYKEAHKKYEKDKHYAHHELENKERN